MANALIIFGTTTGNTEEMSNMIKEVLNNSGIETKVKNVQDAVAEDMKNGADLVVLGCPAYGDDEIELQEDFAEFYEKLDGIGLNGCRYAVFAPGDSSYEHFCGSVDMLEEKIEELGGKLVTEGLKIDGDPGDSKDEILEWAESVAKEIQ